MAPEWRDDPQHFHGQRRHQRALRLHDDRDAADDAVVLRIDREQSAAGRGFLDRRHVAQHSGKRHQIGRRIGTANGEAGLQRHFARRLRRRRRRAGFADDDARLLDRIGQNLVVARQAVELGAGLRVDAAKAMLGDRRRHAVRLGEDHVKTDGNSAELGDARDQIGDGGARPRPLPDRLEACLVDIDDDDRRESARAAAAPETRSKVAAAIPRAAADRQAAAAPARTAARGIPRAPRRTVAPSGLSWS